MSDPSMATFWVRASYLDRLRWWFHGLRYQITEVMPADDDGALLIECSCGGHAQVRRREDGSAQVESATCWRWAFLLKLQRGTLPVARAIP